MYNQFNNRIYNIIVFYFMSVHIEVILDNNKKSIILIYPEDYVQSI